MKTANDTSGTRSVSPGRARMLLVCLAIFLSCLLDGCQSTTPDEARPLSETEREARAMDHRIFYEGWLHPS